MQRLAACLLAALAFVLLAAPSSQAGTSSLRYVALGDSYSAASGVLPPDPEAPPVCMRSTGNYPHVIAAATGATYVNMNKIADGHDACQPLGVRWVEPVLQGTNAVIVHPNALGESQMAAQAMKVLHLR